MRCSKARKLIDRYVDSALPRSTAAELEAHLRSCEACRSEEALIRSVMRRLDQWPAVEPVLGFDSLWDRVQNRPTVADPVPGPARAAPSWAVAALAAAGIAVGTSLGMLTPGSEPAQPPTEQQVASAIGLNSFADSIEASFLHGMETGESEEGQAQ
mgnify:FL=1